MSITSPASAVPLSVVAFVIEAFRGYTVVDVLLAPLALIAVTAIVEGSTRYTGFAHRALNGQVITWFGLLSYSLYLWQQPFLNRNQEAFFTTFPINILVALILASLSYYCIERPLRALRDRYR
jgi:peptidoglycan/LPS O-acetylase OafA/YrhL